MRKKVTLFGREYDLEPARARGHWQVQIHIEDLCEVDWGSLPDQGRINVDGTIEPVPGTLDHAVFVTVFFENRGVVNMPDLGEIKRFGLEQVWRRRNPNAVRLKDLVDGLARYQAQYLEDLAEKTAGRRLLLRFTWSRARQRCQSESDEGDTRIVYITQDQVGDGVLMACTIMKTLVHHQPSPGRSGFKLVVVSAMHEHINPDTEIPRLRAAIAAGNP